MIFYAKYSTLLWSDGKLFIVRSANTGELLHTKYTLFCQAYYEQFPIRPQYIFYGKRFNRPEDIVLGGRKR